MNVSGSIPSPADCTGHQERVANNAVASGASSKRPTKEMSKVSVVIDLEGFQIKTEVLKRCMRESLFGERWDPYYLWGDRNTFVVHEMG